MSSKHSSCHIRTQKVLHSHKKVERKKHLKNIWTYIRKDSQVGGKLRFRFDEI